MTANPRRRRTQQLLAALLCLLAGMGLADTLKPGTKTSSPLQLVSNLASYRLDGGQALGTCGNSSPNALSRLNLGQQINLTTTHPQLLASLSGLGLKSATTARAKGDVSTRAKKRLQGLIMEP